MKRMYKMKMLIVAAMLVVIGSLGSVAQVNSFSGKWSVDSTASDFGGLAADIAAPKIIVVSSVKDSLVVTRTFGAKEPFRESLKIDGSPVETIPNGNTLKVASVKKDGRAIVFNWHYEMNGNEWRYERTENWALSPDGKTLTIDRITTMSDKIDRVKAVYNKSI
ncbi:hypothetical protein [Pedobacter deserti]|uniref:hypothetical protein n=1 Tax=Pedobacter deserti TaxID=2817382 RepID=UPI00210ABEF9|nr:hypothetical protein [Pedobacter sp. SYSU D00382]